MEVGSCPGDSLFLPCARRKEETGEPFGMVWAQCSASQASPSPARKSRSSPSRNPVRPRPALRIQQAATGTRGEFAFRVPVAAMRYSVHAEAHGYAPQDKKRSIEGELRVEVTFLLAPESK